MMQWCDIPHKANRINTLLFYFILRSFTLCVFFFVFLVVSFQNCFFCSPFLRIRIFFTNNTFTHRLCYHTSQLKFTLCIRPYYKFGSGTTLFAINCVCVCAICNILPVCTWVLQFYACIECHTHAHTIQV